FSDGQGVSGVINGGKFATLDYSAYTTPVTVDLAALTATGTGGIANIGGLAGGTGSDTLVGADTANVWHVTGNDTGNVTRTFAFTAARNLTGGPLDARSTFSGGQRVGGAIDGGPGTDTLDYTAYTTPVTVNLPAHTATGTGGIANIEGVVGGAGSD